MLNSSAVSHAKNLISAGKVDRTSGWSFTAADGDALLGSGGDDWAAYAEVHLKINKDSPEKTKAHYGYPVAKGGKVYRRGVIAAKSRAAQQGDSDIEKAADSLLQLIDKDKKDGQDRAMPKNASCTADEWLAMSDDEQMAYCDACAKKGDGESEMIRAVAHVDYFDNWDPTTKFETTPEGYLHGDAIATNIGVFEYMNPDGTIRRELRHPEDVMKSDSMQTLANKPITVWHPGEDVTSKNVDKLAVGLTGSYVRSTAYHLAIPMTITHADGVTAAKKGQSALSCGYDCDLEKAAPGSRYLGTPYDYRQRNIVYNHVALVDKGRAGDAARMRMDSADAFVQRISHKEDSMADNLKIVRLDDGVDYSAEAQVIATLTAHKARADGLQTKLDTITTEKSKLEAERDQQKARADAAVKDLEDLKAKHIDAAELPKLIRARVDMERFATSIGVKVTDGMTDKDLKLAVIKHKCPTLNMDGKDDTYIQASYDFQVENAHADADAQSRAAAGHAGGTDKKDQAQTAKEGERNPDQARQDMIDRNAKAALAATK